MIKCCIFDLDGTILDTISNITYYVNYVFEKRGIDPITEDECKYFAGNGARVLIERSLASRGAGMDEAPSVLSEYLSVYGADPTYLVKPFSGIAELLTALKERGIKLAVLSNKQTESVEHLTNHFFGGLFDVALGGREGVPLKPDPTIAREILDKLGISPSETAWIGDTSVDIETGKNLGAALNIGVLWGFRKYDELKTAGAHLTVSNTDEILTEVLKNA